MAETTVYSRLELITEQDDKHLAGAQKEIRNDLTVIIPENPFPEIEVDAYPPLKFSWIIPKTLAAMAFPRNKENIKFLVNQGITHLVTLTAGKKPPVDDFPQLTWSEIPIEEFEVPDLEQITKFINICKTAEKTGDVIGVHCRQGRARSGVLLACYMVHFHKFLPEQAIETIRNMRSGSCNSPEHEAAVQEYYEHISKNNSSKFGAKPESIDDIVEAARTCNKNLD